MAARAGAAALLAAIASSSLGVEYAYADGPFKLPIFSSPSSAPNPPANAPLPPAAEPSSGQPQKDQKEDERATTAGFDFEALEKGAEALKKIEKSKHAKQVFDIIKKQEDTRQQKMAFKVEEAKKMRAEAELAKQRVVFEEQKKLAQQQAQIKSQMVKYEDELAKKRIVAENEYHRQRNMELVKLQEESSARQQHARRATEEQIEKLRRNTAEEEAKIKQETLKKNAEDQARADAHFAKLNEDVAKRELIDRANAETLRWLDSINTTFDHIGGGLHTLLTDRSKLTEVVIGTTALFAGIFITREGAKVVWNHVDRMLGQPSLVRESSRGKYPWSRLIKRKGSGGSFGSKNGLGDVILHPSLNKRIEQLANATANTKAHEAPFRNMLFYGPPGTGKTMVARELARRSGLDYALMTGGDVAPLGPQAVTKIHELFDWAKKSDKGLLLFIDEADAFLCERNKTYMSEAQRSALNALLFRTGDQSNDIVLALATNRPGDLDSAVSDRIDEVLEFPLPGEDERLKLLKLYLDKYIVQAGSGKSGSLNMFKNLLQPKIEIKGAESGKSGFLSSLFKNQQQKIEIKGLTDDILKEAAVKTEGFSGREIAKLMASVQASVYGSDECVLDAQLFREVVDYKVAEHQQKIKLASEANA